MTRTTLDLTVPGVEPPPGVAVRMPIKFRGVEAWADVEIVSDEYARRARVGLGALKNRTALEVLGTMPADVPIPRASLSMRERRWIGRLPEGAVRLRQGAITRLAVAPVRVVTAAVTVRDWKRGLQDATRFAPYCRRILLLPEAPPDLVHLLVDANFFGVGIGIVGGDSVDWLAPPAEFKPHRYSISSWRFAEQVFDQMRRG